MKFPQISLVLGGVASGKSRFAEALTRSADRPRSYLATAQPFDDEMRLKIVKHQRGRGEGWATTEAPVLLPEALLKQPAGNVVLVDCLTIWLSNLLLAEKEISNCASKVLQAAENSGNPVVFVSNEVGSSVIPDSALGRKFQNAQGQLNQEIAAKADLVVLVTAGIAQVLKGEMP